MSRLLLQFLLLGAAVIATLAHEVPLGENFKYEPKWLLGGAHQVRRRSPLFALGGISCASTPLCSSMMRTTAEWTMHGWTFKVP